MTAEVEKAWAGWAGASAPASRRSSGACCARPTGSSPSPRTSPPRSRPGASTRPTAVIENWAPLADLPSRDNDNEWRIRRGLGDRFVFLYTGTLGLQHRPELLYRLAAQHVDDAEVVVISEGMGEARLRGCCYASGPCPTCACCPVPAHRPVPRRARGGRRAGGAARAHGRHVLSAVQGALVPVRRPPHPGRDPAREPGGPHHRAGGRQAGRVTDRRGGLPRGGQAAAGRRGGAHGSGPGACAYAEATFDTEVIIDRFQHVIERAISRSTTPALRG